MKKYSSLIRPALNRYKKLVVVIFIALCVTAYPLFLLSNWISSLIVIDIEYRPAVEVEVDYNIDISVHENYDSEDKFSNFVVENINKAEHEIFIAMYSFNLENIRDALKSAVDRGVEVTIIYNMDRSVRFYEFWGDYNDKIDIHYLPKFQKPDDNYHMHHKFMVVDPGNKNEILLTGPWNWSHYQEDLDPNILLIIKDHEIIKSYTNELKRLTRATFGHGKFRDFLYIPWDKVITYPNGDSIEIWFSPGRLENSLETRISDLVNSAEKTIDIGVTILDSKIIGKKLLRKAKEGIRVRIVVNVMTAEKEDSIIPWMQEQIDDLDIENIEIYMGGTMQGQEQPEHSIYHHNMLIIDEEKTLSGTANWTFGGFFANDENTLVFKSKEISQRFTEIYEKYLNYLSGK